MAGEATNWSHEQFIGSWSPPLTVGAIPHEPPYVAWLLWVVQSHWHCAAVKSSRTSSAYVAAYVQRMLLPAHKVPVYRTRAVPESGAHSADDVVVMVNSIGPLQGGNGGGGSGSDGGFCGGAGGNARWQLPSADTPVVRLMGPSLFW